MKKPWQGRFQKEMDPAVLDFTASLPFDRRLGLHDLKGSLAHLSMLASRSIIGADEEALLRGGLEEIAEEITAGSFPYDLSFEDIHMNIEKRLIEKVGPDGGRLHTARSRNDQVALDMHLYLRDECKRIDEGLQHLQEVIVGMAEKHEDILMPGYTHLQRAQPVLLAHHMLAYFWMLERDRQRLAGVLERIDLMPLGAGALAGTSFDIDREQVAAYLGFSRLYENSIDAVSDRDYLVEFLAFAAIAVMHLSRLCEEIIIWSSVEFGFIELDDSYTSGSSMMPQKKNPDVAELIRGKTGRIYGSLIGLLTVLKGLPLAYNKDLQEDKEGLFDTVDTLKNLLPPLSGMLGTMVFCRERLAEAVDDDYLCATDMADYLVRRGCTFREAHQTVGQLIAFCRRKNNRLKELTLDQRARFHPALAENIEALLDPVKVVEARLSRGGTASAAVAEQLQKARAVLSAHMTK
ncbi:MAG: argininosuccinate lyase [Firmicutes bacterium ML8_F2]|nr:MAG: argininosuccinate lyase [Firmicutes bacterium ML8_F2]